MKKENIMVVLSGAIFMTVMNVNNVLVAGDASSVTKPLDKLKTLMLVIIGAIGVIDFAQTYHAQYSSTMNSVLKGIFAGVMILCILLILRILGF